MTICFLVSDLHGHPDRFEKLYELIYAQRPAAVFIGGDLLPSGFKGLYEKDFIGKFAEEMSVLKKSMGKDYPEVFIILGNDDGRYEEINIIKAEKKGTWKYAHNKKFTFGHRNIFGYSYIPPTPFLMKDWEKYDISRYTDPGCISPEEGRRTYKIEPNTVKYSTIKKDLEELADNENISNSIILFHSPPYRTNLDRAALDGRYFDSVPLDVHVGSIAIKEFIEERQPYITMHGHIHESAAITGSWKDRIGNTYLFSAAHDGSELAVVKFDIDDPGSAERMLL